MTTAVAEQAVDEVADPIDEEFDFLNEEAPANDPPAAGVEDQETAKAGETSVTPAETKEEHNDAAAGLLDGLDMSDADLVKTLNGPQSATIPPEPVTSEVTESLWRRIRSLENELDGRQSLEQDIRDQSAKVRRLASEKTAAKSAVEEAKGELKAANERYESALTELREMLDEQTMGTRWLNFNPDPVDASYTVTKPAPAVAPASPAVFPPTCSSEPDQSGAEAPTQTELRQVESPPLVDPHVDSSIDVLGQGPLIALYTRQFFDEAKDREEPFGMTTNELSTLESAEITTIGKLEKLMRENRNWESEFKGLGKKKVAKLIESLRVWRVKFPMPT